MFDAARAIASSAAPSQEGAALDLDGIAIPPIYRHGKPRRVWDGLGIGLRQRLSENAARDEAKAAAKQPKLDLEHKPAKRFTTDYAIRWGRAQGWRLLDRERYDARLRRHHDLVLGADAMFESPQGIVMVQGAGRGERAEHRERFERQGGEDRARRLNMRVVYLEFRRDDLAPIKEEWWA